MFFKRILLFPICVTILLWGCKKENRFDLIKRTGDIIEERRELEYFEILEVEGNFNVLLIEDSVCFVNIKAGKNLISNIETNISNKLLKIKNNNKGNFTRSYKNKIEIFIHFKKLNELIYKGTGPITCENVIHNDSFTFNSWDGADTVKLSLDVPLVYTNIHTGVADLIVQGKANQLYAYARGSGSFRMQNFICKRVYTNNISSSDHYFYAENSLEALVQYVGNTYCKGNPKEIIKTEYNKGKLFMIM
ncbi:MAG TPA: DUF2807 domain-containing protein [Bacteroidia bacterium]|nr:DUF2807 domain-containing protein [Bacteroidia bacterium]